MHQRATDEAIVNFGQNNIARFCEHITNFIINKLFSLPQFLWILQ